VLIFARFTQLGLLRLLTNNAVMGDTTLTLGEAWAVYDRWLQDPRVEFYPEPRNVDAAFRRATKPFAGQTAAKWVGDCWLLANAEASRARSVTFDQALCGFDQKRGNRAVIPSSAIADRLGFDASNFAYRDWSVGPEALGSGN